MAHLKKRVTFAGVDYILVPVSLWERAKDEVECATFEYNMNGEPQPISQDSVRLFKEMCDYDGMKLKEPGNV